MESSAGDSIDKLVIFLAKRDGIDKLVKTFQYVSKLVHWHLERRSPNIANRAKSWEVGSGISRKAFRTGRFLTGYNALRRGPRAGTPFLQVCAVLANAGEMVYFLFDHLHWLSRLEAIDAGLATRMSFLSAFGESVGYVFFIVAEVVAIKKGLEEERRLKGGGVGGSEADEMVLVKRRRRIRLERLVRVLAITANLADLVIAVAEVEPNPFCNHAVTLGISGLVSAWTGWYRIWPS